MTRHRQTPDTQQCGGEDIALSGRWMNIFVCSNDQTHTKKISIEPVGLLDVCFYLKVSSFRYNRWVLVLHIPATGYSVH